MQASHKANKRTRDPCPKPQSSNKPHTPAFCPRPCVCQTLALNVVLQDRHTCRHVPLGWAGGPMEVQGGHFVKSRGDLRQAKATLAHRCIILMKHSYLRISLAPGSCSCHVIGQVTSMQDKVISEGHRHDPKMAKCKLWPSMAGHVSAWNYDDIKRRLLTKCKYEGWLRAFIKAHWRHTGGSGS